MVWWFFDVSAICSVFSYINLVHAVAGGMGSAVAITVFYPLETARTRLQVDVYTNSPSSFKVISDIYKQDGVAGLYRGWWSLVVSLFLTNFVYFYVFHGLKAILCFEGLEQFITADLLFGVVAGCAAVLVTNPFWVINTRLKLQQTKFKDSDITIVTCTGILDCLHKIVQTEGVLSLWSGTKSSLLLVSNPSVQFMVYELLKRNLQFLFEAQNLGDTCYFICGASAKIAATLATYPLQIIQTRLRAGLGNKKNGQRTTIYGILKEQGFKGLYKGLEAKLLQTVLTAALMFMIYEKISSAIFALFGVNR